jgi:hypothetical protein
LSSEDAYLAKSQFFSFNYFYFLIATICYYNSIIRTRTRIITMMMIMMMMIIIIIIIIVIIIVIMISISR